MEREWYPSVLNVTRIRDKWENCGCQSLTFCVKSSFCMCECTPLRLRGVGTLEPVHKLTFFSNTSLNNRSLKYACVSNDSTLDILQAGSFCKSYKRLCKEFIRWKHFISNWRRKKRKGKYPLNNADRIRWKVWWKVNLDTADHFELGCMLLCDWVWIL